MSKQVTQTQPRDPLMAKIEALDLAPIKFKLMDKHEGKGWSREYVDHLETEYKRFLYLCTSQDEVPVVPNKDLDEFWHAHILDTRKYAQDCQTTFGRFVHHFPYLGMRGEEDARLLQTSFASTKSLYERVFGERYGGAPNDCENCGSCGSSCGVCSTSGTCGGRDKSALRAAYEQRPTLDSLAGGTAVAPCREPTSSMELKYD